MREIARKNDRNNNEYISAITYEISTSLDENIAFFKKLFKEDDTVIFRDIANNYNKDFKSCLIFFDGMIDPENMNENVIRPIMHSFHLKGVKKDDFFDKLKDKVINANDLYKPDSIEELLEVLFEGDSLLLIDACKEVLVISTKGWQTRSIAEPDYEKVISGPKEGFTESVLINISMLKRRLKTPDLKFKNLKIGTKTHTEIYISYLDQVVNSEILKELEFRLNKIKDMDIIDANYIQESIADSPHSQLRTIGNTERPDVVASKLLEGRIAIFIDGSPSVLTLPYVFIENFIAADDYYINYYFGSINRLIRIISGILSVSIPAIYIAFVTFHQEMIPTPLLLSIAASRKGVPFPTIVEAVVILLAFEIVREAGTRMPTTMGQSISIVGALILGQASVEAKIFSAPIVIVAAVTGITGLLLPKLKGASILTRGIFILLASVVGLYGFIFGVMGMLLYLFSLRSFGISYMAKSGSINPKEVKDTTIRAPIFTMKHHDNLQNSKKTLS